MFDSGHRLSTPSLRVMQAPVHGGKGECFLGGKAVRLHANLTTKLQVSARTKNEYRVVAGLAPRRFVFILRHST